MLATVLIGASVFASRAADFTVLRGGPNNDFAFDVEVDSSDNVYIAGHSQSPVLDGTSNGGSWDALLMKFDASGGHVWTTLHGSTNDEKLHSLKLDASGNIIVVGECKGDSTTDGLTPAGWEDVLIMKFTSAGAHMWTRMRGSSGNDHAFGLQLDPSGNIHTSEPTPDSQSFFQSGYYDIFVMKLNSAGTWAWTVVHQASSTNHMRAHYAEDLKFDVTGSMWLATRPARLCMGSAFLACETPS